MITIYALKCRGNKYYIGKTKKQVHVRFQEHLNGVGSEWTKVHEPVDLLESFEGNDFDEDACTLKYMQKYGVQNVRGGSYAQLFLDSKTREEISRKLSSAENKCHNCLKLGHFIKDCPETSTSDQFVAKLASPEKESKFPFHQERNVCFRCGRKNHFASTCFAKTDRNGKYIKETKVENQKPKSKPVAILVIDIESRGPKVIKNGMYALGYCLGDLKGNVIFQNRIVFDEEKKEFDTRTMIEFWSKHPKVLEALEKEKQPPKTAISKFVQDVKSYESKYDLRIHTNHPAFDIAYVDYYLEYYLDLLPLNYSFSSKDYRAIYDVDSYYRGLLKIEPSVEWLNEQDLIDKYKLTIEDKHDHFPDNDAKFIYKLHCALLDKIKDQNL